MNTESVFPDSEASAQRAHSYCIGFITNALLDPEQSHAAANAYLMSERNNTLAVLALDAAEADNAIAVASYTSELEKNAAESSQTQLAQAYYAGSLVRDWSSYTKLSAMLEAEKAGVAAAVATAAPENHPYEKSNILAMIIDHSPEDRPPDGWIDKYAVNEEQRILLHIEHQATLVHRNPGSQAHRERLESLLRESLVLPNVSAAFLYQPPYRLNDITDPQLRDGIARQRLRSISELADVAGKVDFYQETAQDLMEYPEATDPSLVDKCEQAVQLTIDAMIASGTELTTGKFDEYERLDMMFDFQVALYRYRDRPTSERLVEYVNDLTTALLRSGVPDAYKDAGEHPVEFLFNPVLLSAKLRTKEEIALKRDRKIATLARDAAKVESFDDAHYFISNVADRTIKEECVRDCLTYAKSSANIAAIRPPEIEMAFYPELSLQFDVTDAAVQNNAADLRAAAQELTARLHDPSYKGAQAGNNARTAERILDIAESMEPGLRSELAELFVKATLKAGNHSLFVRDLLPEVVRAGGGAEMVEQHARILMTKVPHPWMGLHSLANFARRIKNWQPKAV